MTKLRRLTLTENILARIALVRRAWALADRGELERHYVDLESVDLATAVVNAYIEQSEQPTTRLPRRSEHVLPVVDVRLTPKRSRRA